MWRCQSCERVTARDPCAYCGADIAPSGARDMDKEVFQWVEAPPPEPPRRRQVETLLDVLVERPGKWARITGPYKNPSYGRNMEKTWAERFPKFEFLARPGLDGDKAYYVYARKRGPGNKRKRA